ncbi:polyprenyl synthetase family protein [Chloroflexota bacterium]
MNLQKELQQYLVALNVALRESAECFLPGPPELDLMLKYHLGWVDSSGNPCKRYSGKQLRPALVLLATEVAGGDWQQALPAAVAVELLHNFSLIHDDIEDGSSLRRGQPALWKIWGAPKTINAGDAMFAWAHLALLQLAKNDVPATSVVQAVELFEKTNIVLTRGQHLDMSFEDKQSVEIDEYIAMISGKSAALIATSMQLGALVAGLSLDASMAYAAFGKNLGLAFQIRDDILGIWGNSEATGKSNSTDIAKRKKSLPVLYGLSKSPALVELYSNENLSVEQIATAIDILDSVDAQEFAQEQENYYSDQAVQLLNVIGGDSHDSSGCLLSQVVEFLLGRTF